MSKRRSYYGPQRIRYPASIKGCRYPVPIGSGEFEIKVGKRTMKKTFEIVQLGGQKYRREHVKDKAYFAGVDAAGKDIMIPYQTCTLVKVREVPSV